MKVHLFYSRERGSENYWSTMTPAGAGKGKAVDFLRQRFLCETGENFILCGDSGNDISMLSLPKYYGVVVNNASVELMDFYESQVEKQGLWITLARQNRTLGVIEGLELYSQKISKKWNVVQF